MIVASHQMIKGYEVYQAISPFATCDLVVMSLGELVRVEVKLAGRKDNGNYNRTLRLRKSPFDLLALVSADFKLIRYEARSARVRELFPSSMEISEKALAAQAAALPRQGRG